MNITKSDFLKYLDCESYFWYWKNKPQVLEERNIDDFTQSLIDQGAQVETYAQRLFHDGELITGNDKVSYTKDLIQAGQKTIFQATFEAEGLYAQIDILDYNDLLGGWDMYEVKSTSAGSKSKTKHLDDATFQKIVLDKSGLRVANVYLIELNKEYTKQGEVDIKNLFVTTEITTEVLEMEELTSTQIGNAKLNLQLTTEPQTCGCIRKSRKNHCPAFKYIYPEIPKYSIYDLQRIGNKKKLLGEFVHDAVYDLKDIRQDHDLSIKQRNQWYTHVHDEVIDRRGEINAILDGLEFPLYFLDYETIGDAIPRFDGSKPYQHVPIQYSIHIKDSPNAEYRHTEYLYDGEGCPFETISNQLRADIGDQGTIIVWYKNFECGRTRELANAIPEMADFLLGLNDRTFDLMEIFSKQLYVHKDFRGSASIKAVMPAVCPDLSYKALAIQNGGAATSKYKELLTQSFSHEERDKIKADLLAYCKLDTWAMVRIYEEMHTTGAKEATLEVIHSRLRATA